MSTVGKKIALQVAANNGHFEDDPQAYCVLSYFNNFHPSDAPDFAICYSEGKFLAYVEHHLIDKIYWASEAFDVKYGDKFKKGDVDGTQG